MPDVPVPLPASAAAPALAAVRRGDVVAAGVTLALGVAGLLALPALAAMEPAEPVPVPAVGALGWWLVVATLVVQAGAVAVARTAPRAALLVVAAVPLGVALAGGGPEVSASGLLTLAVVVAVYRAAVAVPLARIRLALAAGVLLLAVASAVAGVDAVDAPGTPLVALAAAAQALAVVALGLVPALVVSSRRAVRAAQEGELRALAGEQEARVRTALAEQRTAMARELHDLAAHHLSGIALMASAIDRQITTDPEAARRGVREVREQSRVVLADLRRLVGLLREDDGAETSALTLAAVPDLVAAAPGAPRDVTLEVLRAPGADAAPLGAGVGPLAQLAGYRIVQESLANVRTHATGAACRVTVDDRGADSVVLTVRNGVPTGEPRAGDPGHPGYGLRGMRERAELVGADLRHGPTPDGGWEVRLVLPREPRAEEGAP
ncbi:sensor histidine kinase [Cellulomonas sp.]|uniref:sensor histidine kinase n=1 Tax=Cellulomonas sp. TaxID=40001 RepID=UPI002D5AB964|nr:histidine kinase [Cellulomonas sp.]HYQ76828.1 histidine kinase [Cellulomonas sp.]